MIQYPIYVISKGRYDLKSHTAAFLIKDEIDFKIIIEPQEEKEYSNRFGAKRLLILPFSNLGLGGIPARNWCWEHAKSAGAKRHWILDDNIRAMLTFKNGKRVKCHSRPAFEAVEEFTERYSNIGISGINYSMFGFVQPDCRLPPFYLNSRVYSCLLILNEMRWRWRGRYNEDTDLCLQTLTNNLCTVNVNAFLIGKAQTMTIKGGNSDELYKGNGRLKMARSLELAWSHYPGLVKTVRKYNRPQHHVNWKMFKTPLKRIDNASGQA